MHISMRSALKQYGVIVIVACAAFVATLFLQYRADLLAMRPNIQPGIMRTIYEAQSAASDVVLYVTGGCLLATSAVVLCAYISSYVNQKQKELGVLKAMGYSAHELARAFWMFGAGTLAGGLAGTFCGWMYLPLFVDAMNVDHLLPDIEVRVRPELLWWTAVVPAAVMSAVAVLAALHALRQPALALLRGSEDSNTRLLRTGRMPFVTALRRSVRRTRKTLVFFMFFGGFCYASMMQMAPSMHELASDSTGLMMLVIGIVLAVTSLALAAISAVRGRIRSLALMHATGYSTRERMENVLGPYRPFAWAGFAVGTVYQYALLRVMVDVIYRDFPNMPAYSFDTVAFVWTLLTFLVFYEASIASCASRIQMMSLRLADD